VRDKSQSPKRSRSPPKEKKAKKSKSKSRSRSRSKSNEKKKDKKKKDKKKEKKEKKEKKKKKKEKKEKKKADKEAADKIESMDFKKEEKIGVIQLLTRDAFGIVEKTIVKPGVGRKPEKGQEVTIDLVGTLESGKKTPFWTTKDKYGKPYTFTCGIGKVIKGLDAAALSMRRGEQSRFTLSGNFAYGMEGNADLNIPSMATVIFEIEMKDIGQEVNLPTKHELAMIAISKKKMFIDRSGDYADMGRQLAFNSAPF